MNAGERDGLGGEVVSCRLGSLHHKFGSLHHKGRAAFTLIEALAVVTIVGIVLPVAMYGISLSANAASLVKQRAGAAEIAANKLNEILLTGQWQNGDQGGDVGETPPIYHWASHVQDWTETSVHELSVEVTWPSRGQSRSLVLSTLVYDGGNAP